MQSIWNLKRDIIEARLQLLTQQLQKATGTARRGIQRELVATATRHTALMRSVNKRAAVVAVAIAISGCAWQPLNQIAPPSQLDQQRLEALLSNLHDTGKISSSAWSAQQ